MKRCTHRRRLAGLVLLIASAASPASAWDAHGHRTITYLALDGLPSDFPAWAHESPGRHQVAYQSNEADRWRGSRMDYLAHENSPDHYLDVDLLEPFGLTLAKLPKLRYEYLRALVLAKHEHPDTVPPYDAAGDRARTKEWPGLLPYAIVEHYAKLQSSFQTVRILEKLNDPARQHQLAQARANAIYHMGVLGHFVGDAAQPLHTTKHFNGWVGANPNEYTTSNKFHAFIDGDVLDVHGLTYATMRDPMRYDRRVDPRDPWNDALALIGRSFDQVEPLYKLERDRELTQAPGKELIRTQLSDAAATLAAFYRAAWISSAPDEKAIRDFLRFNNFKPELLPEHGQPVTGERAGTAEVTPTGTNGAPATAPTPVAPKP